MSPFVKYVLLAAGFLASATASAAIALDRTRAIFPGNANSLSLTITNENRQHPYLAQAWLEDGNGNKITTPFMVTPPVQRVEPGKKSLIRINALPEVAALPQDRESVFWFSVREVPPKSDRPNVLQVALQTRIKLYYRPASILPARFSRWDDQLVLHRTPQGFRIENPTPYYMTVISVSGSASKADPLFTPVMIAPKSHETITVAPIATPYVTTINDFGGKPTLQYRCVNNVCKGVLPDGKA